MEYTDKFILQCRLEILLIERDRVLLSNKSSVETKVMFLKEIQDNIHEIIEKYKQLTK